MPKLQESHGQYSITLPKELVELKGYKKGQKLAVVFNEHGRLEIRELEK